MLQRRLAAVAVGVLLSAPSALAQKPRATIPNWPAPKTWTPPPDRALREKLEKIEELRGGVTLGIESLPTGPLPFFAVTPCRLLDTRPPANNPLDGDGTYAADEIRTYTLPGACGLPAGIQAVSLNVTATNTGAGAFGHIKIWPADGTEPNVSTLNYPGAGATLANAAVVPLSPTGALKVKSGNATADVILDVNGYYASAATAATKTVSVDCTIGQSIQAAIDREDGPLTVDVHGICSENVLVRRKSVTLRGTNPATDGIQGVPNAGGFPALRLSYVDLVALENLSVSNGAGNGVNLFFSRITLTNCRFNANAGNGLTLSQSTAFGTGLAISNNLAQGVRVETGSFFRCIECDLQNNTLFAAAAVNGGILTLHDSVVAGSRGLLANNASYADIDCLSTDSGHACSLNSSGRAAQAFGGATAAIYGTGNFTGQVESSDSGTVQLIGARQTATGSGNFATNRVSAYGKLVAGTDDIGQSQLFGTTTVSRFGRLMLLDMTTLAGSITCGQAGDAFLDSTIITAPGASITGCEHGALPPP